MANKKNQSKTNKKYNKPSQKSEKINWGKEIANSLDTTKFKQYKKDMQEAKKDFQQYGKNINNAIKKAKSDLIAAGKDFQSFIDRMKYGTQKKEKYSADKKPGYKPKTKPAEKKSAKYDKEGTYKKPEKKTNYEKPKDQKPKTNYDKKETPKPEEKPKEVKTQKDKNKLADKIEKKEEKQEDPNKKYENMLKQIGKETAPYNEAVRKALYIGLAKVWDSDTEYSIQSNEKLYDEVAKAVSKDVFGKDKVNRYDAAHYLGMNEAGLYFAVEGLLGEKRKLTIDSVLKTNATVGQEMVGRITQQKLYHTAKDLSKDEQRAFFKYLKTPKEESPQVEL